MKSYFANQVRQALREGKFKGRIANVTDVDRWNLEKVYQYVLNNDLTPMVISVNQCYNINSDLIHPSLTPNVPIIIGIWNNIATVLDGSHRVGEAKNRKQEYIVAYFLTAEQTEQLNQKGKHL